VLVDSQVRVAGDVESMLATHHRLSGPRRDPDTLPADQHVVWASHTDRQSTYVVRTESPVLDPAWSSVPLGLEDLFLAYMEAAAAPVPAAPSLEVIR
ncbi:MAG: ABC transporter ATP-binding protein, partial [Marmoricola sp.]